MPFRILQLFPVCSVDSWIHIPTTLPRLWTGPAAPHRMSREAGQRVQVPGVSKGLSQVLSAESARVVQAGRRPWLGFGLLRGRGVGADKWAGMVRLELAGAASGSVCTARITAASSASQPDHVVAHCHRIGRCALRPRLAVLLMPHVHPCCRHTPTSPNPPPQPFTLDPPRHSAPPTHTPVSPGSVPRRGVGGGGAGAYIRPAAVRANHHAQSAGLVHGELCGQGGCARWLGTRWRNTRWRWGGDEGLRLVWRAELGVTEAGAAGSCLHPMHAAPTQPRTLPGHVKV